MRVVMLFSPGNQFERFRGCWNQLADSNSIFVAAEIIFERFEFLVCSKFNHMQRDCTCACAAACLHPHNSIPNVVVSLTIHDNICIYVRDVAKNHETFVEGHKT